MRYSTYLAIIALTVTLASSPASADFITYTIDDYSGLGLQNNQSGQPVQVMGTITTNGTLGTYTSANEADILSWDLIFTQGSNSSEFTGVYIAGHTPIIGGAGLDVTATSITLLDGGSLNLVTGGEVSDSIVWSSTNYSNSVTGRNNPLDWSTTTTTFGAPQFSPIAEAASSITPEPASLTLMLVGAGALAGARIVRWRRQTAS
jgi:hypothetical protein